MINNLLLRFGLVDRPVRILYEFSGVTVGLVHILLPFMIFPILGTLQQSIRCWRRAPPTLGRRGGRPSGEWSSPHRAGRDRRLTARVRARDQRVRDTRSARRRTRAVLAGQIYTDVGGLDWPQAAVGSYVLLVLALVAIALFSMLLRAQTGTRRATWEYAR